MKCRSFFGQPSDVAHEVDHDADRLALPYLTNWFLMASECRVESGCHCSMLRRIVLCFVALSVVVVGSGLTASRLHDNGGLLVH